MAEFGNGGAGLDKPKPDHVVEIGETEPKEICGTVEGVELGSISVEVGGVVLGICKRRIVSSMVCWNWLNWLVRLVWKEVWLAEILRRDV